MANTHPYTSGAGNIAQMIGHLRKSFSQTISSDTVKRLGLAPNNESYVINVLQFIGVIDEEGKKTPVASKVFAHHKDADFFKSVSELIKKAYSHVFELHGDGTWNLTTDKLITFFRQSDQTSAAIGKRQTDIFRILVSLAGHSELPSSKAAKAKNTPAASKKNRKRTAMSKETKTAKQAVSSDAKTSRDFGLTVRVEINLPADGTSTSNPFQGRRGRQNIVVSHQSSYFASINHMCTIQEPLADRTVLQMDQTASPYKAFLRSFRKCYQISIWIAVSVYVLIAIIKKKLNLDVSLYALLQILSVTIFEKMPCSKPFKKMEQH